MNADVFAEFLRRRGFTVIKTGNVYCYNVSRFIWQCFPYHTMVEPDPAEIKKNLLHTVVAGVRYVVPPSSSGAESYFIACSASDYGLNLLTKNIRHNTKRGLSRCVVQKINFEYLYEKGRVLQLDTLERQGRDPKIFNDLSWKKYCNAARELPGFEAWGALVDDDLAAFLVVFKMDDCVLYILQRSLRKYLAYYPNNALTMTVTQDILSRESIRMVSYGLKSLHAPDSLDDYKMKMGFNKVMVKERVLLHPFLMPLFNKYSWPLISTCTPRSGEFWKKVSSVIELGIR